MLCIVSLFDIALRINMVKGADKHMKLRFFILLVPIIALMSGCEKISFENDFSNIRIGKSITITIAENEIVDAAYLQNVLSGKIVREGNLPFWDLWDKNELFKMIVYMEHNNFKIIPGTYTFNQASRFEDGLLRTPPGEKQQVFQFQSK